MTGAPLIFALERNALDDGPGIRSVLFVKGCPLRCVWCQNPEGLRAVVELQLNAEACVGCDACVARCPHGVGRPAHEQHAGARCRACGACVDACPAAARRLVGAPLDPERLAAALLEDEPFYRRSGGGVTFSGGEPTLYPRPLGQLAAALRARGVHVLLETCGQFAWEPFAEHLLPQLSAIYFDLKLADADAHRRYCGVDNAQIRANFVRLRHSAVELLPRIPLVPGITDTAANLDALGEWLVALGVERVALLPYNPLWLAKRVPLGQPAVYSHGAWMPEQAVAACAARLAARGLRVQRWAADATPSTFGTGQKSALSSLS